MAQSQPVPLVLPVPDTLSVYAELDQAPLIRVGESYGLGEYWFDGRAQALLRSGDTLVVAVPFRGDVRVFDPAGQFVRRIGRTGNPMEETRPWQLFALRNGELAIYNRLRGQRIEYYVRDDLFVRVDSLPVPLPVPFWRDGPRLYSILGVLPDGSWIFYGSGTRPRMLSKTMSQLTGFSEDSLFFFHLSPDFTTASALGRFFGKRAYSHWVPDDRTMYRESTFEDRTYFAAHDSILLVAVSRDRRISEVGMDGGIRALYAVPAGTPLTTARRARLLRESGRVTPQVEELAERRPHPDSIPFFSEFKVDAMGLMWLRSFATDDEDPSRYRWFIYGRDGSYHGSVLVPADLWVQQITADRLIGEIRSAERGSQVVVYRLLRRR
jgi:hypothetical protein